MASQMPCVGNPSHFSDQLLAELIETGSEDIKQDPSRPHRPGGPSFCHADPDPDQGQLRGQEAAQQAGRPGLLSRGAMANPTPPNSGTTSDSTAVGEPASAAGDPRRAALIASLQQRYADAEARGDAAAKQALFREAVYLNLAPQLWQNGAVDAG